MIAIRVIIIFIICLIMTASLEAEIVEARDIRDVLIYADLDTLVIFDVNGVLIALPQHLGSDQWRDQEFRDRVNSGKTEKEASDEMISIIQKIHLISDVVPVESNTIGVVRRLQKSGISILGLISRNIEMAYPTHQKLHSVDIHLERNQIYKSDLEIEGPYAAKYIEGILFAGMKYDKGTILFRFLDQIGYRPKKIVAVDDTMNKLIAFEKAAESRGIPFLGLHYTHLLDRLKPVDGCIAAKQFELINRVLSDAEAMRLLEARGKK